MPTLGVDIEDGPYAANGEDAQDDDDDDYDDDENPAPVDEFPFTKDDLARLKKSVDESAEENVGMASIFTLVSLLKDAGEELQAEKQRLKEAEREKAIAEQEEREQRKFRGTPVTAESFAEWRTKFRKEFGLDEKKAVTTTKLTGKQIFEQGLIKDEDEDEDYEEADGRDAVTEGVENLSVS